MANSMSATARAVLLKSRWSRVSLKARGNNPAAAQRAASQPKKTSVAT